MTQLYIYSLCIYRQLIYVFTARQLFLFGSPWSPHYVASTRTWNLLISSQKSMLALYVGWELWCFKGEGELKEEYSDFPFNFPWSSRSNFFFSILCLHVCVSLMSVLFRLSVKKHFVCITASCATVCLYFLHLHNHFFSCSWNL